MGYIDIAMYPKVMISLIKISCPLAYPNTTARVFFFQNFLAREPAWRLRSLDPLWYSAAGLHDMAVEVSWAIKFSGVRISVNISSGLNY